MCRVKAIFWWCYMHTESPRPARELFRSMPTDAGIDLPYKTYSVAPKREDDSPEWGDEAVWDELHRTDPHPFSLDQKAHLCLMGSDFRDHPCRLPVQRLPARITELNHYFLSQA